VGGGVGALHLLLAGGGVLALTDVGGAAGAV